MNKLRLTVSAVIPRYEDRKLKDNQYLFVENVESGLWSLPSGKIEYRETPKSALQRECIEEIGVIIEIKGLIGIYQFISLHRNWVTDFAYLGRLLSEPKIIRPGEIAQIKWFNLEKIYDLRKERMLRSGKAQTTPIEDLIYSEGKILPLNLVKKSRGR